jgi:dihydroneopterin aldolase
VDLELGVDTLAAAEAESLRQTVDYAAIAAQVTFVLRAGHFRLLETAAHALSRLLLAPPPAGERRAQIQHVQLQLTKPNALGGTVVPSLSIVRSCDDVELSLQRTSFGWVDIVYENRELGLYRLNIEPGKGIPLHVHREMREAEMVLGEGLLCQGRPVAPWTTHYWPREAAHRYDNPTSRVQTVLCIDSPPFIVADEVLVEGEPAEVAPCRLPHWGAG